MIWSTSPSLLNLSSNEVHIWRVELNQPSATIQFLKNYLDPVEIQRAERFYFEKDRHSFIISRGALRSVLARYLNVQPESVNFHYQAKGKPYLLEPLEFNLSHSGQMALIAVTQVSPLGVDIEYHRQIDSLTSLAKRVFSEQEFKQFQGALAGQQVQVFYNGWTRKEAYIKASGKGLFTELKSFSVSLLPDQPVQFLSLPVNAGLWHLSSFKPAEDYTGALAINLSQETPLDIHYYCYNP